MRTVILRLFAVPFVTPLFAVAIQAQCQPHWESLDVVDVPGGGRANVLWDPDGAGPLSEVLVTGGSFSDAGGQLAANVAAYDFVTRIWSPLGAGVGGTVNALTVLPTGELVVAGAFTTAGGQPADHVALWNGSSWSALGNGLSHNVHALAVMPNGHLVAGGNYSYSGVTAVGYVAEWDGVAWSPLGTFPSLGSIWVRALAVTSGGDLLVGTEGSWTPNCASILRWNGAAWTVLGSMPPITNHPLFPPYGGIYSVIELTNGDIVAGGAFVPLGGSGLCASRYDGSTWSTLGAPGDSGPVTSFALAPSGALWLTGSLRANNVDTAVAVWAGSGLAPLGSGLTGGGDSLAVLPSGGLVVGGGLTLGGTVSHAQWDGVTWSSLAPPNSSLNFRVRSFASLPGGDFVAGGEFTFAGQTAVNKIARRIGSAWVPFGAGLGSNLSGSVNAIAVMPNGDVIGAGGILSGIMRWDGTSWTAIGAGLGPNFGIEALVMMPDGDLVAGGLLNNNGLNGIARWDGTTWSPLGSGFTGVGPQVRALALMPNGDLVAAGYFSTAGGVPANNLARWDGSGWSPLGAGTNAPVNALAVLPNGDVVAGGTFTSAGNGPASRVARWDGSQWHALGAGVGGSSPVVYALGGLPNGDVLVGGEFWSAGGVPAVSIARWNGTAWSTVGSVSFGVYALAELSTGEWVAGGSFDLAGGLVARYVALLTGDCLADATVTGAGCAGSGGVNVLTESALPWTGSVFRAMASGMPTTALAAVVFGLQPAATPLSAFVQQAGAGCMLLANPDVTTLAVPANGTLSTQLVIPNSTAFAGLVLHEQVAVAELDTQGAILAVTSTNALRLTIGSF